MLKIKIFIFLSLIKNSIAPCTRDKRTNEFEKPNNHYSIEKIAKLPSVINESSGVVMINDSTFWTLNDGGGKPELYKVDLKGNLLSKTEIPNSSNIDWEEITTDAKGIVYIGDFGNNNNNRKNLRIYKYNPILCKTDTISFSYLDQFSFPPEKARMNFDCEAMFHHNDSLYLVSKNRGDKTVRFYKISDKPGTYEISPFYKTFISSMITGATMDNDHKKIALLSYGKIYFFDIKTQNSTVLQPCSCMGFARNAQAEGIAYLKKNSLLITNEQGKIFRLTQKNNR